MTPWYREVENIPHGKIYRNYFKWRYPYELVYDDSSVIMSVATLDEARIYGQIEDERRQLLVIRKLKEV